jgi:hypothetical protein
VDVYVCVRAMCACRAVFERAMALFMGVNVFVACISCVCMCVSLIIALACNSVVVIVFESPRYLIIVGQCGLQMCESVCLGLIHFDRIFPSCCCDSRCLCALLM